MSITLGNLKTTVLTVLTDSGSIGTVFKLKLMQPLQRLRLQSSTGLRSPGVKSARFLLQPQLLLLLRGVPNVHASKA